MGGGGHYLPPPDGVILRPLSRARANFVIFSWRNSDSTYSFESQSSQIWLTTHESSTNLLPVTHVHHCVPTCIYWHLSTESKPWSCCWCWRWPSWPSASRSPTPTGSRSRSVPGEGARRWKRAVTFDWDNVALSVGIRRLSSWTLSWPFMPNIHSPNLFLQIYGPDRRSVRSIIL